MSIAEKLTQIAENEQKVYEAGYEKGKAEGGDTEDAYNQGYAEGKQAEHDAFWSDFTANGTRTYYADAFRESAIEYVRPNHKIRPTSKGGAARIFYSCKQLKKAGADYLDFSQIPRGSHISEGYYNTFTMCYELEEIEDIGFVPTFGYGSTFNVCMALRKIAVLRTDENTQFLNDTFGRCAALEEITFEGEIGSDINFQWSTKLTEASIRSIIEHLADTATGKTLTLSKKAVDNAFMFYWEGGEVPGTDENNPYWPQLRDSKPNWTITLV